MARVKPLTGAQLRSLQENLDTDLAAVFDAQAKVKRKLDELSTPGYVEKYKPDALAEMRREQRQRHASGVLNSVKSLPGRKRIIEEQREYWERGFWRDATLYPPSPEIKIGDSLSLLRTERDVQTLAELMAFSSHAQMENTGRLWLTRELELMDADAFVERIEEASAQGNAATIYLASLVADTRSWRSDLEVGRIQGSLAKAEREINLPERTQALDALEKAKGLVLDIESAYESLATGKDDIRARVAPYTEERNARLAAEKAGEEEDKRKVEAIADFLRGVV